MNSNNNNLIISHNNNNNNISNQNNHNNNMINNTLMANSFSSNSRLENFHIGTNNSLFGSNNSNDQSKRNDEASSFEYPFFDLMLKEYLTRYYMDLSDFVKRSNAGNLVPFAYTGIFGFEDVLFADGKFKFNERYKDFQPQEPLLNVQCECPFNKLIFEKCLLESIRPGYGLDEVVKGISHIKINLGNNNNNGEIKVFSTAPQPLLLDLFRSSIKDYIKTFHFIICSNVESIVVYFKDDCLNNNHIINNPNITNPNNSNNSNNSNNTNPNILSITNKTKKRSRVTNECIINRLESDQVKQPEIKQQKNIKETELKLLVKEESNNIESEIDKKKQVIKNNALKLSAVLVSSGVAIKMTQEKSLVDKNNIKIGKGNGKKRLIAEIEEVEEDIRVLKNRRLEIDSNKQLNEFKQPSHQENNELNKIKELKEPKKYEESEPEVLQHEEEKEKEESSNPSKKKHQVMKKKNKISEMNKLKVKIHYYYQKMKDHHTINHIKKLKNKLEDQELIKQKTLISPVVKRSIIRNSTDSVLIKRRKRRE